MADKTDAGVSQYTRGLWMFRPLEIESGDNSSARNVSPSGFFKRDIPVEESEKRLRPNVFVFKTKILSLIIRIILSHKTYSKSFTTRFSLHWKIVSSVGIGRWGDFTY